MRDLRIRLAALALVTGLLACAETPAQAPAGPLGAPVHADDLAGAWVFGTRSEPRPGAVAACAPAQELRLEQEGERLFGSVARCAPCATLETLDGTNRNGEVTLSGAYKGNLDREPTAVTYVLRYDARSQHLVGTRNGEPFWAAPRVALPGCEEAAPR